jgi:signal transduction histidine kinase
MSPSGDLSQRRDALVQAGLVLASELSLPSILQKIVELACEVADARYGALGVLNPDGRMIFDFITHGVTEEERRAIGDLPVGKGILGLLITEARPIRLARIQDHPRSVGFPPNHPPMTSFLGVPIQVRGRVYGNLYLTEKRGAPEFTPEDEEAVVTLAAQAGVAIENARLHEDLRRLAVLEDRERIAQELHDGVIQSLFAVGMGLQAAGAMADHPETVRARLDAAVNDVDRVIRDLRNYIFGLGSGPADRGLSRALHGLADELRRGSDIAIRIDVDPAATGALSSRATDIVQFAREALTNAVRHSGAATVSLEITRDDGSFVLEIEDDGKGFDLEAAEGRGRGLGNLRARAQTLGASLDIASDPGLGTRVRLRVSP